MLRLRLGVLAGAAAALQIDRSCSCLAATPGTEIADSIVVGELMCRGLVDEPQYRQGAEWSDWQ